MESRGFASGGGRGGGAPSRGAGKKNGGAFGAAKFREETSKKADSAAEPHCCGAQRS
jgi:hypothetical protein